MRWGALSHYLGDTIGHEAAVNPSVAIEFPKLAARYGPAVAYDDNPRAHVRTEFAFDIDQISKHRFAPLKYLERVGLKVADDLLERSMEETYGLRMKQIMGKERGTVVRGYRFSVRRFLPRIAYAEVLLHCREFPPATTEPEMNRVVGDLAQSGLENQWEPYRRHAGIGTMRWPG